MLFDFSPLDVWQGYLTGNDGAVREVGSASENLG
jgi:hypothetical protein